MARSTPRTQITDDLDGSPGADTVTFSVMGTFYEIDLGEANTDKLLAALEPFISHARRPVGGRDLSKDRRGTTLRK